MKIQNKLLIGLIVLIILSPIGIIIPEYFKTGDPWGEWGIEYIEKMIGYSPQGLKKIGGIWKAPLTDYNLNSLGNKSLKNSSISYIISGIIGVLSIFLIVIILSKIFLRNKNNSGVKN